MLRRHRLVPQLKPENLEMTAVSRTATIFNTGPYNITVSVNGGTPVAMAAASASGQWRPSSFSVPLVSTPVAGSVNAAGMNILTAVAQGSSLKMINSAPLPVASQDWPYQNAQYYLYFSSYFLGLVAMTDGNGWFWSNLVAPID